MIIDSPIISGSTAATGSLNQVGNVVITGSLTVTGPISGALTGSVDSASFSQTSISASYASNAELLDGLNSTVFTQTGSFNTFSSSILSYTGSTNTRLNALESTSGSLNTASGSAITRLNALETASGSLNTASGSAITRLNALEITTGSLNTASGSAITRLDNLETASGSAITRLNSLETTTGSLNTASGSAITRLGNLEDKTGSYATTGSNTFVSSQYISNTINPTGFTTTASLYTDGGLRVTKDAYVSGTLYLNNVTVYGTQSVNYITSSQLDISDNIINVNTATPNIRFGGLAVYDSGSTSLTGSILWDSQNNNWIYSNPSGSGNYDSSMVIMGPRNASTLGNEQGLNCNYLVLGHGSHHTTSSMVFHDGSATCLPGSVTAGSDLILSATNGNIYGGTALGSSIISNIGGQTYARFYGASHATLPNVTAFVNASSTTLTISNTGDTCFANNVCALNLVSRCNIRVGVNGGYAVISGPTTGAAISLGSNSATFDRNLSLGLVDGSLAFNPVLTINAQTANVGIGMCTPDRRLYITDTSVTQGTFLAYNQCSTFCGTIIEGITDRTSNSAFNLMNLKSSTTSMFTVRGDGLACFASTVCAPVLVAGSTFSILGNGSAYICFYKDYSGSPSNPGFVIVNASGTTTLSHNSNGGTTNMGGNLLVSGVGCFSSTVCAPAFVGGTISGTTGTFSGNIGVTVANTPEVLLTHSNTSKTFLMAVDGSNAFFRANSTNNILFQYAGGTTALNINGSTGATTFSNTVTAAGTGGRSVVLTGLGAGQVAINGDNSTYATSIVFNNQAGGTTLSGIWAYGSGATLNWLGLGGTAYNGASIYLPPSGNVGIGTTSPNASSPLHIKMCSNSNGDGIRIQAICSGASGSQPGIAFANVSDAKRYSISLDNTGDILQITNAAGANTLQINQSSVACFASQTCAPMFISTAGCMASNGIITYSVGGTMVGTTATYFDFPTWNDAGQGQMFEIKAFFDHFYNWSYGAHYYVFLTTRETLSQALTMFNCTTGNGGSWMAYKPDNTTLRVCKVAGSYVGGGAYWIQVTAKQP